MKNSEGCQTALNTEVRAFKSKLAYDAADVVYEGSPMDRVRINLIWRSLPRTYRMKFSVMVSAA